LAALIIFAFQSLVITILMIDCESSIVKYQARNGWRLKTGIKTQKKQKKQTKKQERGGQTKKCPTNQVFFF
jgi:hypothetical protein